MINSCLFVLLFVHALHCQLKRLSLLNNTRLIPLRNCQIPASDAGIYGGPRAMRHIQCLESTQGNIKREYLLGS